MKRTLVTLAAAAIVASPGIASAGPVSDPTSPPYCGPGHVWLPSHGCAQTVLPPEPLDDAGILSALGAAWAVAWFLL